MHYLVTGGSGFIGSAIVRELISLGHDVTVLDNNSRGSVSRLADVLEQIKFVDGDIRSREKLIKAMDGVDSVIHLAYVNGTEFFYSQPELVLDIAIRGMLNVIDVCREYGVKDLVLASSSEAYQTPPIIPTPENVPLTVPDVMNARYSYGGGKLACELMAINYGRNHFDRVTIFRPHNVYGPNMGWEHVLPQFVTRAIKSIEITPSGPINFPIQGDGSQTRSFVYIDDFVSGVMCQIKHGEHLSIYNIGNPEEISIRNVVYEVFKIFGREVQIVEGPLTEGSTQRRCPDITKLQMLGYSPTISFGEGLPRLVGWYEKHLSA